MKLYEKKKDGAWWILAPDWKQKAITITGEIDIVPLLSYEGFVYPLGKDKIVYFGVPDMPYSYGFASRYCQYYTDYSTGTEYKVQR